MAITHYNNVYEFTTDKDEVADRSAGFDTKGISPPEERVYRLRCVEAWSMVIAWARFSLSKLLERVRPMGSAKYVAFETLHDPKRMPARRSKSNFQSHLAGHSCRFI